jgi:hypothetical protein
MSFYWWLIPPGFRRLRGAIYVGTACLASAFVATILTDTLIARPISNNWYDTSDLKYIVFSAANTRWLQGLSKTRWIRYGTHTLPSISIGV